MIVKRSRSYFEVVCAHLFERQGLGSLLGRARLPHADGGAGASGDDELRVGTNGTEDLTPLGQTLVDHQGLKARQLITKTTKTLTTKRSLTRRKQQPCQIRSWPNGS